MVFEEDLAAAAIRVAIGSSPHAVFGLVMREGVALVGVLLLGIVLVLLFWALLR